MSISFGTFRLAVRDPTYRMSPGPAGPPPITPIGTFRKAVSVYHRSGQQAALNGIMLTSEYWRKDSRGKSLAQNYHASLRAYFRLDIDDGRRVFDAAVKHMVPIAGENLNVYIDALVYDAAGHSARVALWDVPLPTPTQVAVMAAPIIDALRDAVGQERAQSVAFWHLRTGTVFEVESEAALAHATQASEAVRRAAGK